MSDSENLVTSTAPATPQQTPENTVAPFENKPKKKQKHWRQVAKERAEANGWPYNSSARSMADVYTDPKSHLLASSVNALPVDNRATDILRSLVERLVALENDGQYRSVWLHFFQHGGVFTGPNYTEELRAACAYLIGVDSAKPST